MEVNIVIFHYDAQSGGNKQWCPQVLYQFKKSFTCCADKWGELFIWISSWNYRIQIVYVHTACNEPLARQWCSLIKTIFLCIINLVWKSNFKSGVLLMLLYNLECFIGITISFCACLIVCQSAADLSLALFRGMISYAAPALWPWDWASLCHTTELGPDLTGCWSCVN